MRLGALVAVPAAIGPLPLAQRAREQLHPLVVRRPKPARHRDRVALLRRTAARAAFDHRHAIQTGRPREPGKHRLERRERPRLAGRYAELHERDEPPVRAAPLAVGMTAEAAVRLLPAEQSSDELAVEDAPLVVDRALAQEVAAREEPDGWLVGRYEPVDGGSVHRERLYCVVRRR